jgi:hypothetical protein
MGKITVIFLIKLLFFFLLQRGDSGEDRLPCPSVGTAKKRQGLRFREAFEDREREENIELTIIAYIIHAGLKDKWPSALLGMLYGSFAVVEAPTFFA